MAPVRRGRLAALAICSAVLGPCLYAGAAPASASTWAVGLAASSAGEGTAQGPPSPPSSVTATCSLVSNKVTVTWTPVAPRTTTTYSVYQSTSSATSGYSLAASGLTGTSWTTGTLVLGNYWFEVATVLGANWKGPNSAATAESTITLALLCTQP